MARIDQVCLYQAINLAMTLYWYIKLSITPWHYGIISQLLQWHQTVSLGQVKVWVLIKYAHAGNQNNSLSASIN